MLLSLNKALNEHCLLFANKQADKKTKLNSKIISADILSLLTKQLN